MAAIPKTHTAAIFHQSGGPLKIEKIPTPQPSELKQGEILVKLEYSGVCHTDLHAMLGDWPVPPKLPLVGGHEGAGRIVYIAPGTTTSLKVGDAVGLKWIAYSCNDCEDCREGYEPICESFKCHGYTEDGSFQVYAKAWVNQTTPIPDGLSLEDAAPLLCAGVTVYKALKETGARPGQIVAIPGGGGGLGHLAVQYARAMGLNVIAIDTGDEKRKLVESLDKDAKWIDFKTSKDLVADIKAAAGGKGPHAAVVAAAGAAAYEQAIDYVRHHGTVVAVGLPPNAKMTADVFFTVFHMKRIVGSYVGNRQDAIEALDFGAKGKVKTIYKTYPLEALAEIYDKMHKGQLAGRTVLKLPSA